MATIDLISEELRRRSAAARAQGRPYVIGIGGSVAVGKSTFAGQLRDAVSAWLERPIVDGIATDGFLFPNTVLAERGIAMRKGFPESYDVEALRAAIATIKAGEAVPLPRYSHATYDVDRDDPLTVHNPGMMLFDGLHLAQIERAAPPCLIDTLIYLDAPEDVIARWFTDRLLPLMLAGRDDPKSFYFAFRDMDDAGRRDFARRVWNGINLPNLREHIVKDRDAADLVVTKTADHAIASAVWKSA